jgi:hypothetical protein
MKKIYILLILIVIQLSALAQCPSCPNIVGLTDDKGCQQIPLDAQPSTTGITFANNDSSTVAVFCKGSISTLCFIPAPVFFQGNSCPFAPPILDSITITGGTVISISNNCVTIQWSNAGSAFLDVAWKLGQDPSDPNKACRSKANVYVKLLDAPIANFNANPQPACFSNPTAISFNSNSSTNAVQYFWNFGDGYTGFGANPTHNYTSAGTYTVCLTVSNDTNFSINGGSPVGGPSGINPCTSCSDSICKVITIDALPPPPIGCITTVCDSTKAQYCTDNTCTTFNWTVNGGTIISGAGTSCIDVKWFSGVPQGNIQLTVGGCATTYCSNGNNITVPIVSDTAIMIGDASPCIGDISNYSVPNLPGTNYVWSVSGGGSFIGVNQDVSTIPITWNSYGTFTVSVNYNNPITGCGGDAQFVVTVLPKIKITGPTKLCAFNLANFTASEIVSGAPNNCNWTVAPAGSIASGQNTNAVSIFFPAANTYTVTATGISPNTACAPVQFIVKVNPNPVISGITGTTEICPLGSSDHGLITTQHNGLFSWTIYSGFAFPLNAVGDSVTAVWTGNADSISVSQIDKNGCPSNTFTMPVTQINSATVVGPTNACADATTTYTVTSPSSGNFNWSISPAQYGTVVSGQGTNIASITWNGTNIPGNVNTVYLHYGTCNTDSIAINITDPFPVVITPSGTYCTGGVTLTTNTTSGTYLWDRIPSPIVPTQSNTNNTLVGLEYGGVYSVTVGNANNSGCNISGSINLPNTGRPKAIASTAQPILYCLPTLPNNVLSAVTGAGYTYDWYLSNAFNVVGANIGSGPTITVNSGPPANMNGAGSYFFTLIVTLGTCADTSLPININVDTCGPGSCSDTLVITSITGCNPFVVHSTVLGPPGSILLPGQTIYHYDAPLIAGDTLTRVYPTIGYKNIRVCRSIQLLSGAICVACKDTSVLVSVAAGFIYNQNCGVVNFVNSSGVVAPNTITSYAWSLTDAIGNPVAPGVGSFNNPAAATPVLTFNQPGFYNITLTVTASNGCVVTYKDTITSTVANANFGVTGACLSSATTFTAAVSSGTHNWDFGDGAASYVTPTIHTFATAGLFNVTHIVTNDFGCKDTIITPINILPQQGCVLALTGSYNMCTGDTSVLQGCVGLVNYKWYRNFNLISGANTSSLNVTTTGTYYMIAIDPSSGCTVYSDTVIFNVTPSPIVDIDSTGPLCDPDPVTFSVQNCPGCTFNWTVDGNLVSSTSTFLGFANTFPLTLGTHTISVSVTNLGGCTRSDSVVMNVNVKPTVTASIAGPTPVCSGNNYTFTAVHNAASPSYNWTYNNLSVSTTVTANGSAAGLYILSVTDGTTGCSNSSTVQINESPDLSLFPIGCETLCDSDTVIIPLPNLNGNYGAYTIDWYLNPPPFSPVFATGTSVAVSLFNPMGSNNNVAVIVTGANGCADTSTIFNFTRVPVCPDTSFVLGGTALGINSITLFGQLNNLSSTLKWAASNITETRSMQLLRSTDGINFEAIKEFTQQDLALQNGQMQWIDNLLKPATVYYYKVVDYKIDGKNIESNTIQLRTDGLAGSVLVYPTSTRNKINVVSTNVANEEMYITISNHTGAIVHKELNKVQSGVNTFEISVAQLAAGVYTLSTTTGSGVTVTKFIKE